MLVGNWLIKPAGEEVERAKVAGSTLASIFCIPHIALVETVYF